MTRNDLCKYIESLLGLDTNQLNLLINSRAKSLPEGQDPLHHFVEEIIFKTKDRKLDYYWYQFQETLEKRKSA